MLLPISPPCGSLGLRRLFRCVLILSVAGVVGNVRALGVAAAAEGSGGDMSCGSSGVTNVAVNIAMEAEAMPFVEAMSLVEDKSFFPAEAPFRAYRGKIYSQPSDESQPFCEVTVVTNGKDEVHGTGVDNCGTVPASLATFLTLQKLKQPSDEKAGIDLLINAGTCGGFKSMGAAIGDVYLTTSSANHDRRIPIPAFVPYGIGKLDHHSSVSDLASTLNMKTGRVTTGNSLDMTDTDATHIKDNEAHVKDMEAAAVAWAAQLFQVPFFGVKVVTDIVDGGRPTQEEFLENLHAASVSLQEALPRLIRHVCGKTLLEAQE